MKTHFPMPNDESSEKVSLDRRSIDVNLKENTKSDRKISVRLTFLSTIVFFFISKILVSLCQKVTFYVLRFFFHVVSLLVRNSAKNKSASFCIQMPQKKKESKFQKKLRTFYMFTYLNESASIQCKRTVHYEPK